MFSLMGGGYRRKERVTLYSLYSFYLYLNDHLFSEGKGVHIPVFEITSDIKKLKEAAANNDLFFWATSGNDLFLFLSPSWLFLQSYSDR